MTMTLTILHYVLCIFLILVVLLQTGKGSDISSAFGGGGGGGSVFGATGASTLLNKTTALVAGLFMMTSVGLTYVGTAERTKSVMGNVKLENMPKENQPAAGQTPSSKKDVPAAAATMMKQDGNAALDGMGVDEALMKQLESEIEHSEIDPELLDEEDGVDIDGMHSDGVEKKTGSKTEAGEAPKPKSGK